MRLKSKEFQEVCKAILLSVDNNAANLELKTKENSLFLNVTNREYYTSIKFELDAAEEFHAVVDASLFLNLISGITTDDFELTIKGNTVIVKAGKSSYKLAMIYENNALLSLPVIKLENETVSMPISVDILKSILNVNSKELLKVKNMKVVDMSELQKLYYITESGCFTFTTGACLNSFTLEKPIKLLLNDRIVKLFKLFKEDISFSFGHDEYNGTVQTKAIFQTENIYLATLITNDEILLNKVQRPYEATKKFIETEYQNKLVLSVNDLSAAISRLMLFTKNSVDKANMQSVNATLSFNNNELTITDKQDNSEVITIENGSFIDSDYSLKINLFDIKLVLDSCKDEHITLNCGNEKSVVLTRGAISNLIPEGKRD